MTTTPRSDRVLPLRKLIHLSGAGFPLLYMVAPRQTVLVVGLLVLAATVTVEWGRQRLPALERLFEWFIGPALRQGEERKPTTGTWSMLGILTTLLAFQRAFAIPAMFYAQIGDPAAEVLGRRWGRHRLRSGKSLEGSLGCFLVSALIGLFCSQLLPLNPGIAVWGALVAAVAEAAPLPIGDNLFMAPLAGLGMHLAALVA
jgi:dolichol kinase